MAWSSFDQSGSKLTRALSDLPVGTIVSTALSAAPSGWLICDGAAVSRTNYPELFGALGTGYGAGDGTTTFNVPNSDGQMILAISTAQRIGVAMPPQFVTTLPASPIDGTEVYYQSTTAGTGGGASNSMADVGVIWHLRYRAASPSAYKWEVAAAPPIGHYNVGGRLYSTVETTSSTTFVALATRTRVTAPLAGDYRVDFTASNDSQGTTPTYHMAVRVFKTGDTAGLWSTNDAMNTLVSSTQPGWGYGNLTGMTYRTGCAASDVIELYHAVGGGSSGFFNRNISITPIRVSA